jgi:threonine/homoserine/homoserine lactone efflux protein
MDGVLVMMATLSLTSLTGGTILACCAERFAERAARAELIAGLMIVFGLVVIGAALALVY